MINYKESLENLNSDIYASAKRLNIKNVDLISPLSLVLEMEGIIRMCRPDHDRLNWMDGKSYGELMRIYPGPDESNRNIRDAIDAEWEEEDSDE